MSEIITIHVGQCGNTLAPIFWETLCHEHGVDPTGTYHGDSDRQLERINAFFHKGTGERFIPRAILADLETTTIDRVQATLYGQLFRPGNIVKGQTGAGNNWAKGYYTEGAELIDNVLDVIRGEADNCSDLQGFILIHSLGGGVGAGMGSLLIEKLREEYTNQIITTFSVFPSPKVSDTVVEPYNAVLSIKKLISYADLVFCLDNEALYNIAARSLKITAPTEADLNAIIADAISNITSPLRFLSQDPNDLDTLQAMVNKLVPSENHNLHFLTVGLSPLRCNQNKQPDPSTAAAAIEQVIQPGNMLVSSTSDGKNLAASSLIFRGEATLQEIQNHISTLQADGRIADNLMALKFDVQPPRLKKAAILIKNNSCVLDMFKRIAEQFTVKFRRKEFLHWYTGEGMDEMEFVEAESSLSDLITEYINPEYLEFEEE